MITSVQESLYSIQKPAYLEEAHHNKTLSKKVNLGPAFVWQEPNSVKKIMEVDSHIGCAMSGLTADARTLVDHGRVETQVSLPDTIPVDYRQGWRIQMIGTQGVKFIRVQIDVARASVIHLAQDHEGLKGFQRPIRASKN